MRVAAFACALAWIAACDDTLAPADFAIADLAGCRSPEQTCPPGACATYPELVGSACPLHESVEAGQCGGYDILVFHNGMTTTTTFYDRTTGQFVASVDERGSCSAPPGFLFPICGPGTSSFLCLDLGVTD